MGFRFSSFDKYPKEVVKWGATRKEIAVPEEIKKNHEGKRPGKKGDRGEMLDLGMHQQKEWKKGGFEMQIPPEKTGTSLEEEGRAAQH